MGGGKSGGASVPQFVADAAQSLSQRSERLFDLSRPLLETGTGQVAELIRTGGSTANVPIINNAVAAQQTAGRLASTGLEGQTTVQRRGNIPDQFAARTNERMRQATSSAARRIPFQAAAPLIGAATAGAMSGGRQAQQGFAGAAGALAAGQRVPTRSAAAQNAGASVMQALLFGSQGGFGSFGGGKNQGGGMTTNPFGSGMSPTGGFLIGPGGMLGGGV